MPLENPTLRNARRLKTTDQAFHKALAALRRDYNAAYDAALRAHNRTMTTLQDHFDHPPEFHEMIEEARQAFLAGFVQAHQSRQSGAATLSRKG